MVTDDSIVYSLHNIAASLTILLPQVIPGATVCPEQQTTLSGRLVHIAKQLIRFKRSCHRQIFQNGTRDTANILIYKLWVEKHCKPIVKMIN